jgi:hypothetical protein
LKSTTRQGTTGGENGIDDDNTASAAKENHLSHDNHDNNDDRNDPRIQVQYPSGSTYHVRRSNLVPVVLEDQSNIIVVASETNDYRRTAIVNTLPNEHFVEIGCDFGILVDSVRCVTTLGIDKSETSIEIAKSRYPTRQYILGDIFEAEEKDMIFQTIQSNTRQVEEQNLNSSSLVVAIDINGNRELPAVLKCIEIMLDLSPRLIIVKSRALYARLKKNDVV